MTGPLPCLLLFLLKLVLGRFGSWVDIGWLSMQMILFSRRDG